MKIEKPLPGMTLKETESQLSYINAVIKFKIMHSSEIISKNDLRICEEEMRKKVQFTAAILSKRVVI